MLYTWACPRRSIGTSLGLDRDENSYLGGLERKKSVPVFAWFSASVSGDFVRIHGKFIRCSNLKENSEDSKGFYGVLSVNGFP